MNGNKPCQTDKIRSSVVDTRQCDSAPGEAQTHNPSNSSLALSGNWKIVQCVVKGLQSKRPQVKTSPSQNVPKLVKTSPKIGQNVPMVKNVGQNVPKMIFSSRF